MTFPGITSPSFERGLVVIRPLRSITSAQADTVAQAVAALPGPWVAEHHDDYDGYLSIVVSLADADAPTFAVSGRVDHIELSEIHDDDLIERGCFVTIEAACAALTGLQTRHSA